MSRTTASPTRLERPSRRGALRARREGMTLLELMVVLTIISVLAAITGSRYTTYIERVRVTRATVDIRNISIEIRGWVLDRGYVPASLADVGQDGLLDPWGNPYRYLPLAPTGPAAKKGKGGKNTGKARKDRFLVPINSDYDLYSMGADGESVSPLTAKKSRDDVIRANDGAFVGLAIDY